MKKIARFQIGKNGLVPQLVETLTAAFKNHRQIRISVLKSSPRDKEKILSYIKEIQGRLAFKTRARIIGFTIVLSRN